MGCSNSNAKEEIKEENKQIGNQEIKKQEIEIKEEEIKQIEPPIVEAIPQLNTNKNKNINNNVIWLDPNIDIIENSEKLKLKLDSLNIKIIKNLNEAINHLKKTKFKQIKLILTEEIYSKFVQKYKENLVNMNFSLTVYIYKITEEGKIIFNNNYNSNNNNNDINYINNNDNKEYTTYEEILFEFGGIINDLDELENILKLGKDILEYEETKKDTFDIPVQLTFEFIDNKTKLLLPLSFKSLIDKAANDNMIEYTNTIFDVYSHNSDIRKLLNDIQSFNNITIENLSKYYAKFYTIESGFYRDINESLRLNDVEKFLTFIRTLYEGVRLKALPLACDNVLYRGTKISKLEIEKINDNIKNKIENLPGLIAFSKPFLSFTKEREVATRFISPNYNNNLTNVLFVLEKDNDVGYNLSTHCDLENLSFFPGEKEVLFFPFSSFEIKDIKEIELGGEEGYEIRLLYLGKYLKDIENDPNIIMDENDIPDSEFKKQLIDFGLIKKEKIEKMNPKELIKKFKKFENAINNNTINSIKGEINIDSNNTNKNIQIINSFENYQRTRNVELNENDNINMNEQEIKENIEIKINGKTINFNYLYQFESNGVYQIEYIFKKFLKKTNHMFADCKYITNFDFSNFNTEYNENMSYMFSGCESLIKLDLSNFETQNVKNMNNMFYNCNSLKNLNLSNFDTKNVTEMNNFLALCDSLINLNAPFDYH
jgi:surface protein